MKFAQKDAMKINKQKFYILLKYVVTGLNMTEAKNSIYRLLFKHILAHIIL